MHALAKFQKYLMGNRFRVKIDHKNLRHFLGHKGLNHRQHKWVSSIQVYDFDIVCQGQA